MTALWRAVPPLAADALRALRRYAWPVPLAERPRNRRYLRDRLVALPLLTVVAAVTFGWAYADVREDSATLRDSFLPALVGLAEAETSLRIADREAAESLAAGEAVQLSGLSKRYTTRTTRAVQHLNQVARSGALTTAERQELDVVSGLVVDYGTWITFAQNNVADPTLRDAGLSYARSMLCSAPGPAPTGKAGADGYPACRPATGSRSDATAVVDRISSLEDRLRDRLADRAAPGGRVLATASLSALALVLLACGHWRTQVFVHHRLHLHVSVPLLVAALPLLAVPFLTADAVLAHRAQQRVVSTAAGIAERTTPAIESTVDDDPFGARHPLLIRSLDEHANRDLAAGRLSSLDGVAPWVAPAGLLSAGVTAVTLHAYRREYVLVSRPGATP
ncbi:hypothetical protein [Streptomyces venezuelae]|uniref:hypothetical protein n=1 Tax=Streptomyces venezuelae TaxID=54571 RepID=UPI001CC245D5|nr:hypothetical protein [Streptomyces venezuelae]